MSLRDFMARVRTQPWERKPRGDVELGISFRLSVGPVPVTSTLCDGDW
jgi:hypothetical protein